MATQPTQNPVGSEAVQDVLFNAGILDRRLNDRTVDELPDRFGVLRLTWSGIEQRAKIDIGAAVAASTALAEQFKDQAQVARDDAVAAAGAIGPIKFYDNLAEALADIANLTEGDLVELARDEEFGGARTRRSFLAGALAFAVNLDQLRIDLDADKGALRVADAVARVATLQDLKALPKPSRKTVVRVDGYAQASDGGGGSFLYIPGSNKEPNEITVIAPDAGGTGRWERGLDDGAIHFEWGGVFSNSGQDETTRINALLTLADSLKCKVRAPSGRYLHNGYYNNAPTYHFDLEGDAADPPVFEATQAAVDAGTVRLFRCEPDDDATLLSGVGLAQSAYPNDRGIYLTSVAGISPGMVLQLSSAELWYYDNRSIYTKGELHVVRSVDPGTGFVGFDDMVRDSYRTNDGYTKYVRAWVPSTFRLKNAEIVMPLATIPAGTETVGVQFSNACEPEVANVRVEGMVNWGVKSIRCIRPRHTKIRGKNIGAGLSNGYCVQDNGSLGLVIFDIDTVGCRRAFDAHGLQGNNGCVSRDWLVMNFRIAGGGAYFPDTAEESYGLGMHGPTENGKYANGFIRDVAYGINSRSRNIEADNVNFGGTMLACVSLSYGTGLTIQNCSTDGNDYAQKTGRAGAPGITDFLRLGISPGDASPNALYSLPIVVKGNVLKGIRASLVRFMAPTNARNIFVENNTVEARPINDGGYINSGVFRMYAAGSPGGAYSVAGTNTANRVSVTDGTYELRPSSNMAIGAATSGVIEPLLADDKEWLVTMAKDTVMKIPLFNRSGERPIVSINADAGGMSLVRITPANATLAAVVGSGNSAGIVGTATPEALTGTTGIDGNITVGVTASGDLWLENRSSGGAKQFRISRVS